jgi:hypothetical protein
MTRAKKGARSWRACRGCPERPSKEVSDGWLLVDASSDGGLARRSFSEDGTTASMGPGQKSHVERRKARVPDAG